ncbi:SET domain-containing protein, partial [Mytilinidion resinicola]
PKADIDSEWTGNWTRFVNHSCEPNARFWPYRVGNHLVMVVEAVEEILAGTEITADYGKEYLARYGPHCLC